MDLRARHPVHGDFVSGPGRTRDRVPFHRDSGHDKHTHGRSPPRSGGDQLVFSSLKCQMPSSSLPLVSTMLSSVLFVVSPVWLEKKALPAMER